MALVASLDDLVVVHGAVIEQPTCENDGSGPMQPGTTVNVALRDGASLDTVRTSATAALERMGYEIAPEEGVWFVARRQLTPDRGAEIEIIDSNAKEYEMVVFT